MRPHGCVFWFTGLSGSGKSTLASLLCQHFLQQKYPHECLDGDAVRAALSPRLGFTQQDRNEHVHRIGYIAQLLTKHGIHTVVAAISPYQQARLHVRNNVRHFVEIHCHAPLQTLIQRDPKGLYQRALQGEIPHFTGISDPYEPPENPEIFLNTASLNIQECFDRILKTIDAMRII
jgi:adenylylsulfate kinase